MSLELINRIKTLEARIENLQQIAVMPSLSGTAFPTTNLYDKRSFFRTDLGAWYYYSSTEFSGPAAGWYKSGVGVTDNFPGANTAVIPWRAESGQGWFPAAGTWGIIGPNRLYSVTTVDGDMVVIDSSTTDPTLQFVTTGTRNSGVNLSFQNLLFRYFDVNNFMMAVANQGNVELYKDDGGAFTKLANTAVATPDNTDLTLTVSCNANVISVYLNGVLKITHTLAVANYKYLAYTKTGVRQSFAGAPAFPARSDNFIVRQAA